MKRLRRPLVLALVGLSLGASLLLAPTPAQAKKRGGEAKLDKICAEISCSDTQRQDIAQVFEQMHIDIKPDRTAAKDLKKQLAREWVEDRPSEKVLAKLSTKIAAHERNIAERRLEAMLELHDLLDAQQRQKVAQHLMKGGKGKNKSKAKAKGKAKAKNKAR